MKIRPQNRKALLRAALGRNRASFDPKRKLVNVLTGEIYPADVYASGVHRPRGVRAAGEIRLRRRR